MKPEKKIIDMSTYKGKEQFDKFVKYQNPHSQLTIDFDVTKLVKFCKERQVSFYITLIHLVDIAANKVPEFRQRIEDDKLVEYSFCQTNHIETVDKGERYCYVSLNHDMPFDEYIKHAQEQKIKYLENPTIKEEDDSISKYFFSCAPWFRFSEFTQPMPNDKDTNPRFVWSKYEEDFKGRLMLSMSIVTHHALVDGHHLAMFVDNLNEEIDKLEV